MAGTEMKNVVLIALVVLVIVFVLYQYDSSLCGLLKTYQGFEDVKGDSEKMNREMEEGFAEKPEDATDPKKVAANKAMVANKAMGANGAAKDAKDADDVKDANEETETKYSDFVKIVLESIINKNGFQIYKKIQLFEFFKLLNVRKFQTNL